LTIFLRIGRPFLSVDVNVYGASTRHLRASAFCLLDCTEQAGLYTPLEYALSFSSVMIMMTITMKMADRAAWLPGICQMGRLVRHAGGPPRQILK